MQQNQPSKRARVLVYYCIQQRVVASAIQPPQPPPLKLSATRKPTLTWYYPYEWRKPEPPCLPLPCYSLRLLARNFDTELIFSSTAVPRNRDVVFLFFAALAENRLEWTGVIVPIVNNIFTNNTGVRIVLMITRSRLRKTQLDRMVRHPAYEAEGTKNVTICTLYPDVRHAYFYKNKGLGTPVPLVWYEENWPNSFQKIAELLAPIVTDEILEQSITGVRTLSWFYGQSATPNELADIPLPRSLTTLFEGFHCQVTTPGKVPAGYGVVVYFHLMRADAGTDTGLLTSTIENLVKQRQNEIVIVAFARKNDLTAKRLADLPRHLNPIQERFQQHCVIVSFEYFEDAKSGKLQWKHNVETLFDMCTLLEQSVDMREAYQKASNELRVPQGGSVNTPPLQLLEQPKPTPAAASQPPADKQVSKPMAAAATAAPPPSYAAMHHLR